MNPTVPGQGARLVVGRSRRNLMQIDTSAFSQLQKPAVDPGPVVPGDLPVRTMTDVTKGLGLSYEAERDLTRALEEWIDSPDPITFRGRVTRGLRGFAPDNFAVRNEVWRRASSLYRSINPITHRRPNSVVIQKAEDRTAINRWKAGEFLRLNPNPTDDKVHDFAREIGMDKDALEEVIYELATEHAQRHMGKGEQIPGGRAAGKKPDDFDVEQLSVGTHHELEHTANRAMAMEIAMDHLAEDPNYYRKLKKIEKSEQGWEPMPGIDGGLRRSVQGGYEYRFPAADLTAGPDPALARVLNAAPSAQPPELLFCYGGDDEMTKGADHKYIKRVPTGKPKPKWRYIYKHPKRKGLVVDEHLVSGTKLKVRHAGELGHFEILEHDEAKGVVKVKHDETGRVAHIKKRDLARMLQAHHEKEGKLAAEATPAEDKSALGKLPRVQMNDLARGEWEHTVGFEATEAKALELAANLKKGWDYAAIKQPGGFLVVTRRQRRGEKAPRVRYGEAVKVHLRNEKPMNAVYTLMEAEDVVASHNPANFNIRKDYPEGVQERQYHESDNEQGKVMRIAQEMEPVFVINNNPDGVNGTPIITQDGIVLGGNARTMGIQRAYSTEPGSAKKYKNYLTAHAKDYGFNAADVRGMKQPILVRRSKVGKTHKRYKSDGEFDKTKYNAHLRLLGRRMNEGLTQGLDPRAEEVALGKNFVDARMLRTLTDSIKEGQTLDQFLQGEGSRNFLLTLRSNGIIDDLNASQYLYGKSGGTDKGLLNKEGRARLERILVGKLIDSPTLLDRMSQTQRQALANSAVHVVVAQQSGWDVVPTLKRAIEIDQSIQKMDKELQAEGSPRKALKNFLSGKQTDFPAVGGMVEEVRNDKMLHHLLMVVREHAGTDKMPRDFKGFSLRAREDAQRNPELTGAQDMFGGSEHAAKREDPADALDIEFGITPPRKQDKAAKRKAALEEKKRQEDERKRIKKERAAMASGEGSLFRSMGYSFDLIKADGPQPNRLVTRAINHVELLVDAAVSNSMLEHGEIRVDGAKIVRQVMADIDESVRKDPELAREQGRSPLDAKVVRGLIEAFCQMRGKDLLEKGRKPSQGGEALLAHHAGQAKPKQKRPPGTGWTPPSGKRRSWRKRVGGKYVYWTSRKGLHGDQQQLVPRDRPTDKDLGVTASKAWRREVLDESLATDAVRRADAVAERLKAAAVVPGKYHQHVEHYERARKNLSYHVMNDPNGVRGVLDVSHQLITTAAELADKMEATEGRQKTMFGVEPPKVEKLELSPAEVKEHARTAYSLGASKDPGQFSRYMSNLVEKHGTAQAKLVMDQVASLQEGRRGKATARAPKRPKRAAGQQSMFSGHQATQAGEQGDLFQSMAKSLITFQDLEDFGRQQDIADPGWRARQRAQMTADWLEDGIPQDRIDAWFDAAAKPRRLVVR